jgi:hypothetical protein
MVKLTLSNRHPSRFAIVRGRLGTRRSHVRTRLPATKKSTLARLRAKQSSKTPRAKVQRRVARAGRLFAPQTSRTPTKSRESPCSFKTVSSRLSLLRCFTAKPSQDLSPAPCCHVSPWRSRLRHLYVLYPSRFLLLQLDLKFGYRHSRIVLPRSFTASPTLRRALPRVSWRLALRRSAAPCFSILRLPTACPIFSFTVPFALLILPLISALFGSPIAKLSTFSIITPAWSQLAGDLIHSKQPAIFGGPGLIPSLVSRLGSSSLGVAANCSGPPTTIAKAPKEQDQHQENNQ